MVASLAKSSVPPRWSQVHVPELDGVRALAIWLVLLKHALFEFPNPPGALAEMPRVLYQILNHGWLGVDLFFVLSGFLITGILLDSKAAPHYFRNFYARRVLRIVPLFYVCIVVMWWYYGAGYTPYFLTSLLFLANFASGYGVPTPHGAGIFWSLCIEEHFYLLWPLLVWWLTRRGVAWFAVVVCVLSPLLRAWAVQRGVSIETQIYQFSYYRFDGLALGSLLACWWRMWPLVTRRHATLLAAALLSSAALITLAGLPFGILGKTTVGVALRYTQVQLGFAALLVFALGWRGTWLMWPLRTAFARVSGKLSYCLYLVNLAIGDAYVHWAQPWEPHWQAMWGATSVVLLRSATVLLVSFCVAALSWRWLEAPVLRLKRHFSSARALAEST